MQMPQKQSGDVSPTKRQMLIIFFLATTLFMSAVVMAGRDRHWWMPKTEIAGSLVPEDIKIKLDANSAPWYELVLLPKLGEAKAKAIVAYREKYGSFKTIDDLANVQGIGTAVIEAIQGHITIGAAPDITVPGKQRR